MISPAVTLRRSVLASICIVLSAAFSAPARAAEFHLSPCRVEHPSHAVAVDAECGTLTVLENPAQPDGRRIGLQVARVPAISRRKKSDPLFVISGGPGMASSDFYSGAAGAFARIRRDRDIVLVDQRGTGRSNGLHCELNEEEMLRAEEKVLAAETQRCLTTLQTRADVRYYTTSVAVQDLDAVRAALGYTRINIYGVSYGTRVAQHYARRFPDRVRTMILDGVVPPGLALGPSLALDAEAALKNILARCASDMPCKERFGDPAVSYQELRQALSRRPASISIADPTTGKPHTIEFTELHLAMVLRLASYTSEQAALLPLSLHLAHREGNFTPLASQFLLVSQSYQEMLAYGMHNSVVCSEDVPFYELDKIDRERLARTYLGTTQLDALQQICNVWPRGPVDADFHQPLRSDIPTLLMSGSDDPVTPPAYAEQAKRGLTHSLHVELKGLGHGQLGAPCVDRLMAHFVDRGKTEKLDASCTARARPMPFFTSLAGPAP